MIRAWIALTLLGVTAALAQESASHKLEEHVFNAGGHPEAVISPSSASHRLGLGSLGESFPIQRLSGATMLLEGGFITPYPPPGEVPDLLFTDQTTLVWDPEPSAGSYNLYRGAISALSGLGYGSCSQQSLPAPATTDPDLPAVHGGYFYFVTVENRLGEEGTKGYDSGGVEHGGMTCP